MTENGEKIYMKPHRENNNEGNLNASCSVPESRHLGSGRRFDKCWLDQQPQEAKTGACQDSHQLPCPSLDMFLHGSGKPGPELDGVPERMVPAWPFRLLLAHPNPGVELEIGQILTLPHTQQVLGNSK